MYTDLYLLESLQIIEKEYYGLFKIDYNQMTSGLPSRKQKLILTCLDLQKLTILNDMLLSNYQPYKIINSKRRKLNQSTEESFKLIFNIFL